MEETQKPVTLSDLNIVQLKAIAYDEIVRLNMAQAILQNINRELSTRQQQGVEGAEPVTKQ